MLQRIIIKPFFFRDRAKIFSSQLVWTVERLEVTSNVVAFSGCMQSGGANFIRLKLTYLMVDLLQIACEDQID